MPRNVGSAVGVARLTLDPIVSGDPANLPVTLRRNATEPHVPSGRFKCDIDDVIEYISSQIRSVREHSEGCKSTSFFVNCITVQNPNLFEVRKRKFERMLSEVMYQYEMALQHPEDERAEFWQVLGETNPVLAKKFLAYIPKFQRKKGPAKGSMHDRVRRRVDAAIVRIDQGEDFNTATKNALVDVGYRAEHTGNVLRYLRKRVREELKRRYQ